MSPLKNYLTRYSNKKDFTYQIDIIKEFPVDIFSLKHTERETVVYKGCGDEAVSKCDYDK